MGGNNSMSQQTPRISGPATSGKIFNMTMGAPSVSNVSKSVVTASKDNTKELFIKGAGNDTNN